MKATGSESRAAIGVTLAEPEFYALDAWRERQPDAPQRGEALRRLAMLALRDVGGSNTIALEDLNASNDD